MINRVYYVYILSSGKNGTLYVGVTGDLLQRVKYHKDKINKNSFTARYNVSKLVFFEEFTNIYDAIKQEKNIKNHDRSWKIELINRVNPDWKDLYYESRL